MLRRLYGALNSAQERSSLAAEVSRRRYAGPDLDQPRGQPAAPRGDLIVLSEQSAEGTSATRRSTTTASTGTQWDKGLIDYLSTSGASTRSGPSAEFDDLHVSSNSGTGSSTSTKRGLILFMGSGIWDLAAIW